MKCASPNGFEGFKDSLLYFLLGDKILPPNTWLMRPFAGSLYDSQKIFNYRLSRAKHKIENALSILVEKWRIFKRKMRPSIETVQ